MHHACIPYLSYIPYLSTKLQDTSHLDLVWDTCLEDLVKGTARPKCRKRVYRPGNWQSLLHVDCNNMELFRFLSEDALKWFDEDDKQLVFTNGEGVLSKPPLEDLASLLYAAMRKPTSCTTLKGLSSSTMTGQAAALA